MTEPARVLVMMPTWVGDVVMATPTLRALRARWPEAHLAALVLESAAPVIDPCPRLDEVIVRRKGESLDTIGAIRGGRFDTAILLPNSFRSALLIRFAGVGRRVGYRRDGRGLLLTDRLDPPREGRGYRPVPAIDYYLALAGRLGADASDRRMELFTRLEDDEAAARSGAFDFDGPIVMLNPGAATKGAAKLWPAERFAAVADRLIAQRGVRVLLNGAPAERAILDAVHHAAKHELIDLPELGSNLRRLKSYAKRSDLLITNDTGARHIAAALGTPVVSLFGPTDPAWTLLEAHAERIVRSPDGTMAGIGVDTVVDAALAMLHPSRPSPASPSP